MLGTFYTWLVGQLEYEELFFDVLSGKMLPIMRKRPRG